MAEHRGPARAAAGRSACDLRLVWTQRRTGRMRAARCRISFTDERNHRDADGAVYDGLSGGAGREVEHEATRGAAAGAELFHMADAGARRRPQTGRCCRTDGPSHRWRKVSKMIFGTGLR